MRVSDEGTDYNGVERVRESSRDQHGASGLAGIRSRTQGQRERVAKGTQRPCCCFLFTEPHLKPEVEEALFM